jgi:hypothetical protein
MAVKSKEEILNNIKTRFGEQNDDSAIQFLEDITDTIEDLESKAKGDGTDWKAKYEENDAEWRKKYTERFYSPDPKSDPDPKPEPEKPKNFSDLFKTE